MLSKHNNKRNRKPSPQSPPFLATSNRYALLDLNPLPVPESAPSYITTANRYALLAPNPKPRTRPPRLPPEVWGLVLSRLPFYLLWTLRSVCRTWRDEIEFQLPWRLRKQHRIVTGIVNKPKVRWHWECVHFNPTTLTFEYQLQKGNMMVIKSRKPLSELTLTFDLEGWEEYMFAPLAYSVKLHQSALPPGPESRPDHITTPGVAADAFAATDAFHSPATIFQAQASNFQAQASNFHLSFHFTKIQLPNTLTAAQNATLANAGLAGATTVPGPATATGLTALLHPDTGSTVFIKAHRIVATLSFLLHGTIAPITLFPERLILLRQALCNAGVCVRDLLPALACHPGSAGGGAVSGWPEDDTGEFAPLPASLWEDELENDSGGRAADSPLSDASILLRSPYVQQWLVRSASDDAAVVVAQLKAQAVRALCLKGVLRVLKRQYGWNVRERGVWEWAAACVARRGGRLETIGMWGMAEKIAERMVEKKRERIKRKKSGEEERRDGMGRLIVG